MKWNLDYNSIRALFLCPYRLSMIQGKYPPPIRALRLFPFTKSTKALTHHLKSSKAFRHELITLNAMLLNTRTSKTFTRYEKPSLNLHATKIPDAPDLLLFENNNAQPRKLFISYDQELLELDRSHAAVHDGEVWDIVNGEIVPASTRNLYDIWETALLDYHPTPRPNIELCKRCSARQNPTCRFTAEGIL
jgi:hypothetical protein